MSDDDMWLFKSYSDQADVEAVAEVIERGTWWAKGPEIEEFERMIADRSSRDYGVAFNSGTSAAFANLLAVDVTGGEVIVPSFTFPATANVVVAADAEPVFADIEPESLALDPDDVREKVTSETRAIMPIHFAGDVSARIHELVAIANEYDVPLIEDAAHSLGATYDGDPVGSFGESAMFSFCFNKVLTTGEGGMIVTDSDALKRDLELVRSHGRNEDKVYVDYGYNFRMSSMTAALGVSQAGKLDHIVSRRREMAEYLNERLAGIEGVRLPTFPPDRDSVYQLYNLRFDDPAVRDALRDHLAEHGIPTRVTYDPVHLTRYYRSEWGWSEGDLPVTEAVSDRILTLPFHLDLDTDDLDRIVDRVRTFFRADE